MSARYLVGTMRGKERLAILFWYYFVLGGAAVALLIAGASVPIGQIHSVPLMLVASSVVAVPVLAYQIWILVSLWACAFNARHRYWGYLTRAYVLVLVSGGLLEEAPGIYQWLRDNA
jgi:hypothetical protein